MNVIDGMTSAAAEALKASALRRDGAHRESIVLRTPGSHPGPRWETCPTTGLTLAGVHVPKPFCTSCPLFVPSLIKSHPH